MELSKDFVSTSHDFPWALTAAGARQTPDSKEPSQGLNWRHVDTIGFLHMPCFFYCNVFFLVNDGMKTTQTQNMLQARNELTSMG